MEKGYIKLWRCIEDDELLSRDNTCYIVFTKLLTLVDWKTGKYNCGRRQLAAACNMKPSTVYAALMRLRKMNAVSTQSSSRMTTIYICNWRKYQMDDNSTMNDSSTHNGTKQEVRKRSKNNKKEIIKKKVIKLDGYEEMMQFWSDHANRKLSDSAASRKAFKALAKDHSIDEIKFAILGATYFQGKAYKPQVMSFSSMHEKWDSLIGHMQSEKAKKEASHANYFG